MCVPVPPNTITCGTHLQQTRWENISELLEIHLIQSSNLKKTWCKIFYLFDGIFELGSPRTEGRKGCPRP